MQSHTITVTSRIDPNTFYRFAVFDTLKLRKRWLSPAVFAGIFLLCSLICFLMRERTESAAFLEPSFWQWALGFRQSISVHFSAP